MKFIILGLMFLDILMGIIFVVAELITDLNGYFDQDGVYHRKEKK